MDKIIRCITSDGAVMASAIDASDIVFTAQRLHHLSRSATAALGCTICHAARPPRWADCSARPPSWAPCSSKRTRSSTCA